MSNDNPAVDPVSIDEQPVASDLETHIKSRSTWLRLLFMLIYAALISLASLVGTFVVVLGFLWVLFTGETNSQLRQAGQGIASYVYEIIRFLTYNSDEKPFPFGKEFPSTESAE